MTKYITDINIIDTADDYIYLYGEILPVDDKEMSHEIILLGRNKVYIEFERIVFKKVRFK